MPIPEPSAENRIAALERQLTKASVDLAATAAYVDDCLSRIAEQDEQIKELSLAIAQMGNSGQERSSDESATENTAEPI